SDRANVNSAIPLPLGGRPHLVQPANLLLPGAAVVNLGDRNRRAIAIPGLADPVRGRGDRSHPVDPDRLEIDEAVATVRTDLHPRIALHAMVQEAVAGQVIVEADDVWSSLASGKFVEALLGHLLAQ